MEKKINTFRPIINTYYNACLMFKFCSGFIFCGHISCTSAKKNRSQNNTGNIYNTAKALPYSELVKQLYLKLVIKLIRVK